MDQPLNVEWHNDKAETQDEVSDFCGQVFFWQEQWNEFLKVFLQKLSLPKSSWTSHLSTETFPGMVMKETQSRAGQNGQIDGKTSYCPAELFSDSTIAKPS